MNLISHMVFDITYGTSRKLFIVIFFALVAVFCTMDAGVLDRCQQNAPIEFISKLYTDGTGNETSSAGDHPPLQFPKNLIDPHVAIKAQHEW